MDSLSMNIFVPENKPAPKNNKKKQKESAPPEPKLTVVKSSLKTPVSTKSSVQIKKSPFTKTTPGKIVPSTPFLVSANFNKNDGKTNDSNKTFSVSFVKPKLFKTSSKPPKNESKNSPRKEIPQNSALNDQDGFTAGFASPKLFSTKKGVKKETFKITKKFDNTNNDQIQNLIGADEDVSEGKTFNKTRREIPRRSPVAVDSVNEVNSITEQGVKRDVDVAKKWDTIFNKVDGSHQFSNADKDVSKGWAFNKNRRETPRKAAITVDSVNEVNSYTKQGVKRDVEVSQKWDTVFNKVDGSHQFSNEVVSSDEDFSEGFSTDAKRGKFNSSRGSALFEAGAWKANKSGNKWFVNESSKSGPIHVDFSGVKGKPVERKEKSAETNGKSAIIAAQKGGEDGRKVKLKRKFDEDGGDEDKKRRRYEFESKEPLKAGQMSSLFSYSAPPEPLNDVDVEPLEERLFSRKTFQDAGVHPHLVGNLEQLFGITNMTVVQKKSLPELMAGKDGLIRSQTGSGKTLAYAIPIMHSLQAATPKLTRKDGVKALIVLPTRELALQTYECFRKLMRAFTWIVPGIVVGGEKRKSEKVRLRKGINVLIGTPGRLLDHAQHSENLSLHGIDWLIIDEADKLLEMGYEKDVSQLMSIIDDQREKSDHVGRKQTVLLSATLTSAVEKLANLALKDPVHIDACKNIPETVDVMVIPQGLEQKYVVVPAKMKLVALASFIIDVTELRKSNKLMIFMATQDMVDFYTDLIPSVLSSTVKFFKLHGNMSQGDRTEVFNAFRKSEKGVLLSTDVAARGLDLPNVDWIVQYTAPTTPAEYVHRVGRTARVGTKGSSLLFLLPSELHFVTMLNSSRVKLEEINIDQYLKCLMKIHLESRDGQRWGGGIEGAASVLQHNFETAILEDRTLHDIACKAYKSWVRFYATYPKELRVVFNFKSLHLGHNAKSFALRDPPRAIGGIGKPKKGEKWGKGSDMRPIRRKKDNLGHVTESSRTKRLILSEYDSGLKSTKKT